MKTKIVYIAIAVALLLLAIFLFNYYNGMFNMELCNMGSVCGSGRFGLVELIVGLILTILIIWIVLIIFADGKKKRCPHCGKETKSTWLVCPYCGSKLDNIKIG